MLVDPDTHVIWNGYWSLQQYEQLDLCQLLAKQGSNYNIVQWEE